MQYFIKETDDDSILKKKNRNGGKENQCLETQESMRHGKEGMVWKLFKKNLRNEIMPKSEMALLLVSHMTQSLCF